MPQAPQYQPPPPPSYAPPQYQPPPPPTFAAPQYQPPPVPAYAPPPAPQAAPAGGKKSSKFLVLGLVLGGLFLVAVALILFFALKH
jgi:hypothetical protein